MLTLGITGHRDMQRPYWVVLSNLHSAVEQLGRMVKIDNICLLSALAEGADTIAVEYLLQRFCCRLEVPLPMPASDYEEDFSSPASVQHFRRLLKRADHTFTLSEKALRPDVYELVGKYLVSHCDLLLAFWDGLPALGQGGTASVVASAREKELPICWIKTARRGQKQEVRPTFTFENLEKMTR